MLLKILKNDLCTGCGLCQSIIGRSKVEVKLNTEGFYRPHILNEILPSETTLISKVCPAITIKRSRGNPPVYDDIWGSIYACFVGRAYDDSIVNQASSGGAISAILKYMLETKIVDAVIHIGASEIAPYVNEVKISTTVVDILKNANSRYSPSAPLIDITNQLNGFDRFVFVGKPCDIAAIRQYSQINGIIKDKIKFYISFFCAGIPSLNATKNIISSFGLELQNIKTLYYRTGGWPGSFNVTDVDDNQFKLSYKETWMKKLSPHIQFRCKICADGIGEFADLVCADAWHDFDEKGFPSFKNAKGRSLILSRTKVGNDILNCTIKGKVLRVLKAKVNLREIDKMQPGQYSKKVYFFPRMIALKLLFKFTPTFSKDLYIKAAIKSNKIVAFQNFIGSLKREVKKMIKVRL